MRRERGKEKGEITQINKSLTYRPPLLRRLTPATSAARSEGWEAAVEGREDEGEDEGSEAVEGDEGEGELSSVVGSVVASSRSSGTEARHVSLLTWSESDKVGQSLKYHKMANYVRILDIKVSMEVSGQEPSFYDFRIF